MSAEDDQYQVIVEICQKSQEIFDKRIKELTKVFLKLLEETKKLGPLPDLQIFEFGRILNNLPETDRKTLYRGRTHSTIGIPEILTSIKSEEDLKAQVLLIEFMQSETYEALWKDLKQPVKIKNADFSGKLFHHARFENCEFVNCNFSKSMWIFSIMTKCNCTGSNFSDVKSPLITPFSDSNCSGCNFSNAEFVFFDFFSADFTRTNFTEAKLLTSHSFFSEENLKTPSNFSEAAMDGCELDIAKEGRGIPGNKSKRELKAILEKIFSPQQLSVMDVNFGAGSSGCFIATASCGKYSEEVRILRQFRDRRLQKQFLGRLFIRAYHRVSPQIALWIEDSPRIKYFVRNTVIRPIAKIVRLMSKS